MTLSVYGLTPIPFSDKTNIYEFVYISGKALVQSIVPSCWGLKETRMIVIEDFPCKSDKIERRYKKMQHPNSYNDNIEYIEAEVQDDYSDDSLFNISSWGADLSFRELANMYEDDELVKPELQRKYVWDKVEASRFIESILLGLPVPSIFLAQAGSQKLIVDGYQRIMTVYDYMHGIFSSDKKVFKLSNSEKINARWRNKAFSELSTDDQRKLRSTTIHAIIFEQKKPENDDTSLYQVFERINTSGRTLTAQEIRNCVYQGPLNSLLFELNENAEWRELFGSEDADNRMRDIEYILRFFVMKTDVVLNSESKQISLKKVLNEFMNTHKNASIEIIAQFKSEFERTIHLVSNCIGVNAFRNYTRNKFSKKFHPAIFDAVMISAFLIDQHGTPLPEVPPDMHKELFENEAFKDSISKRTTDIHNIKQRIQLAGEILFGVNLR